MKSKGLLSGLLALVVALVAFGYEALTGQPVDELLGQPTPLVVATRPATPRAVPTPRPPSGPTSAPASVSGDATLQEAFEQQRSDLMVEGVGTVERLLADDNEGSRHQRFILRLESGQTLLVSHNIDLAPRAPLEPGDRVEFRGEYEWNAQGGILHWTHHDPQGRHPDGWLRVGGETYQ